MADLGLTQSFSRPRVSNDNAFSESQFKTLKYRPEFPGRFGSLADAKAFCQRFFEWYNHEHYHSSLGLLTPWSVHSGEFELVLAKRQEALDRAYAAHPERFVRGRPTPQRPPERRLDQRAAGRGDLEMIDPQAVVKLGAGSGVVNSVPQFSGGRRGVLQRRVGSPQLLHGRPTCLSQALDVMRLQ